MSMTVDPARMSALQTQIDGAARKHRLIFWGGLVAILGYLALSWVQFDIGGLQKNWRPDRASLLVLDTYAYKDHVTMRWKNPDDIEVTYEGGHRYVYDPAPAWFETGTDGGQTVVYGNGGRASFYADRIELDWPGEPQVYVMRRGEERRPYVEGFETNPEDLPPWIRVTKSKIEVRPSLFERLQVGRSKVEAHRYQVGWGFFWFDFNSPLKDYGFFSGLGLMFSGERVVPEMSNARLVWTEFRDNQIWGHGQVLYAMLETIFMALIGTMIASAVGLPLAFMAARNVQPLGGVRFVLRRLFDILRGVDTLIWSLIFLRAFGPGLFTGIFAIAFTDTGTLGKLMSEAIENADNNQREGIQSTGAAKVQQHRFGILPQIMPVFISQSLYYLESNTRSATIIGALGAGGIGLQFLGALQTGNDFEDVAYYSLLVLITVVAMDALSARLRRALIGGETRAR